MANWFPNHRTVVPLMTEGRIVRSNCARIATRTAKSRIVAITLRRDERLGDQKTYQSSLLSAIVFGSACTTRTLQVSCENRPEP
jgi:hypothetical protein